MFNFLLEKVLEVTKVTKVSDHASPFYSAPETRRGIKALLRVYKDHERGLDPDPADLDEALEMAEQYYSEFVYYWEWTGQEKEDLWFHRKGQEEEYEERLKEIKAALRSKDPRQKSIVLDTAINQWHTDTRVIAHLTLHGDPKIGHPARKVYNILDRLGRLTPPPED